MNRHGVVTSPRKATSNGVQKSNLQTKGRQKRSPDIHVGGEGHYINNNYSKMESKEEFVVLAALNTFIKENFLLDEENQNIITKPINRI